METSTELAISDTNAHGISTSISFLADAWPKLPPHVREAIITLVDVALRPRPEDSHSRGSSHNDTLATPHEARSTTNSPAQAAREGF